MPAHDPPPAHRLLLAFHGVYLFNIWPRFIEIIVPRVPHHMYVVEAPQKNGHQMFGLLDSATLTLTGVPGEAAPPKPDDSSTIVIRNHRSLAPAPDTFCRLFVPFPKVMLPVRCNIAVGGPPIFGGPSAAEVQNTRKFPACQVFAYENVDPETLSFGPDLPWMPEEDDNHCVHLRLYAERAMCEKSSGHFTSAFDSLTALVPDFKVALLPDKKFTSGSCGPLPQYALPEDLQPLRTRLGMMCGDADPPDDCGGMVNVNSGGG